MQRLFDGAGNLAGAVFVMSNRSMAKRESPPDPLEQLYRRPGFMIRRVHQIAVSLFLEETGGLGITNRQWGILFVLKHRPGIDQISVAKLLGLDRSTAGMVLGKLEADGLVKRVVGLRDKRRHHLQLTPAGEVMLAKLAGPARRARTRALSAFTPREQTLFLDLLGKFIEKFNSTTRVPLDQRRSQPKQAKAVGPKCHPCLRNKK